MINKIPLPTDNLYKFKALSGLILILLSFTPLLLVMELTSEATLIKGEIQKYEIDRDVISVRTKDLSAESKLLNTQTKDLEIKVNNLKSTIEGLNKEVNNAHEQFNNSEEEKNKYKFKLDQIQAACDEHSKLNKTYFDKIQSIENMTENISNLICKQRKIGVDLHTKNELLKNKNTQLDLFQILSIIIFFSGLYLSCHGFKCWYSRTQKFQDMILKNQANHDGIDKNDIK